MRTLLMALAATALSAGPFALTAMAADTVSPADRSFVAMVSQGGMFEVALGRLAADHGNAQDIRDQGATEAHDHQAVGDTLKAVATAAGITVPDQLNAMFQQKLDGLKTLSGAAFDTAYILTMKDIHAKDGAAFAKEAKLGTNRPLRDFAAETYRIVVMHEGELRAVLPPGR